MSDDGRKTGSGGRGEQLRDRLWTLQRDPTSRWRATVLLGTLGGLLSTVHWSGLFVGGALVGAVWPTLRRAVVAGFGYGLALVVVFAVELGLAGSVGATLSFGVLGVVPFVLPLVAGPLGALARGLVADAPENVAARASAEAE